SASSTASSAPIAGPSSRRSVPAPSKSSTRTPGSRAPRASRADARLRSPVTPRPRRELWLRARAASILLGAGSVACAGATSACSGGSGEGSPEASTGGDAPDAAGDEPVAHTYAPTFTALYGEVFTTTCALLFCHGGSDDF